MAFRGKNVIGIVPARGGSRGLPKKNVLPMNGFPLIYYSIEAGLKSAYVDTVMVTSDDAEILQVATSYGAEILKRPSELAAHSTYMHDVIAHALRHTDAEFEVVILLQPTSPLRTARHVDRAFEALMVHESNSLIGVYRLGKSISKSFIIDEAGFLSGVLGEDAPYKNREDLPDLFMPNGSIYIFDVEDFKKHDRMPVERIVPFVMEAEESLDIDDREDFDMVERIMRKSDQQGGSSTEVKR